MKNKIRVNNNKLYGIDKHKDTKKLKIKDVELYKCDLRNTSFSDNKFDIIFCLDVLEHFENLNKPIAEIKRILKPKWNSKIDKRKKKNNI